MKDKKQIISELYALRAGLSVISEQKDKVEDTQHATEMDIGPTRDEMYGNMLRYYRRFTKEYTEDQYHRGNGVDLTFAGPRDYLYEQSSVADWAKKKYNDQRVKFGKKYRSNLKANLRNGSFEQAVDDYCERIEERIENAKINDAKYKRRANLALILLFIGLIAVVVSIFAFSANLIVMGVGIAVGAILMLIGLILCVKNRKHINGKAWVQYNENEIAHMKKAAAEILSQYKEVEVKEQEEIKKIKPYKEVSLEMYNILINTYGEMIDPRDWEYLDLIIYYFETGRAITMREALQLLDRERQTQQIVGAVREATNAICRSIERGFATLENTMRSGFASLQSSIDSGFARMNAIGMAQVKEMQLTNSLLNKANTTSEQLMNDVHFMRTKMFY